MLEKYPNGFYLASLAGDNTANKALNRAAYTLEDAGCIRIIKYNMGMHHVHYSDRPKAFGGPKLVSQRPDTDDGPGREILEQRFHEIQEDSASALSAKRREAARTGDGPHGEEKQNRPIDGQRSFR